MVKQDTESAEFGAQKTSKWAIEILDDSESDQDEKMFPGTKGLLHQLKGV